jgi:membrane protein DedA with SNARE-associated domain/membrane-associated phospholipid phosphatase
MTAVGALAGSAVVPLYSVLLWSTIGAYCGDILSYWLGYRYKHLLLTRWPLKNHPQWITRCEQFFEDHGGKSLIIGRFVAPMRSLVPMVAGILNMRPGPFLPLAFISAIIWAIVYLIPGVLLGALSAEAPPALATKLIIVILSLLILGWLGSWIAKIIYRKTHDTVATAIDNWWTRQAYRHTKIWQFFAPARDPESFVPLLLTVAALVLTTIFAVVAYQVMTQSGLSLLNEPFKALARSLHFDSLTAIMIWISYIGGEKQILTVVVAVTLAWLFYERQWWTLSCLLMLSIVVGAAITGLKPVFAVARPTGILVQKTSYSFPSGHTTIAFSIPCFLAFLLGKHSRLWLKPLMATALSLALVVAFSRLYLTAHWFTDVIGGLLLGLTLLAIFIAVYVRGRVEKLTVLPFAMVIATAWVVAVFGYAWLTFSNDQHSYQLVWPQGNITYQQWWPSTAQNNQQTNNAVLPLYRYNRLGQPVAALNINYLGEMKTFGKQLTQNGWKTLPKGGDWRSIIQRYVIHRQNDKLPILSALYRNQRPSLLMYHPESKEHPPLILRLWPSGFNVVDSQQPLWLGSVEFYKPPYHYWLKNSTDETTYSPVPLLAKDLHMDHQKIDHIIPSQNYKIKWDKRILYVQSKG